MKGEDNFGDSYKKLCKINGNKKDPFSSRSYTFLRAGSTQEKLEPSIVLSCAFKSRGKAGRGGTDAGRRMKNRALSKTNDILVLNIYSSEACIRNCLTWSKVPLWLSCTVLGCTCEYLKQIRICSVYFQTHPFIKVFKLA